jgi:hypothetical protein
VLDEREQRAARDLIAAAAESGERDFQFTTPQGGMPCAIFPYAEPRRLVYLTREELDAIALEGLVELRAAGGGTVSGSVTDAGFHAAAAWAREAGAARGLGRFLSGMWPGGAGRRHPSAPAPPRPDVEDPPDELDDVVFHGDAIDPAEPMTDDRSTGDVAAVPAAGLSLTGLGTGTPPPTPAGAARPPAAAPAVAPPAPPAPAVSAPPVAPTATPAPPAREPALRAAGGEVGGRARVVPAPPPAVLLMKTTLPAARKPPATPAPQAPPPAPPALPASPGVPAPPGPGTASSAMPASTVPGPTMPGLTQPPPLAPAADAPAPVAAPERARRRRSREAEEGADDAAFQELCGKCFGATWDRMPEGLRQFLSNVRRRAMAARPYTDLTSTQVIALAIETWRSMSIMRPMMERGERQTAAHAPVPAPPAANATPPGGSAAPARPAPGPSRAPVEPANRPPSGKDAR